MISINGVSKWYGSFQVLTDCSPSSGCSAAPRLRRATSGPTSALDPEMINEDCAKEEFFGTQRSERAQLFLSKILPH